MEQRIPSINLIRPWVGFLAFKVYVTRTNIVRTITAKIRRILERGRESKCLKLRLTWKVSKGTLNSKEDNSVVVLFIVSSSLAMIDNSVVQVSFSKYLYRSTVTLCGTTKTIL